jgi:hypothetical protein
MISTISQKRTTPIGGVGRGRFIGRGFECSRADATLSKWTSTRSSAAKFELERHVWGTFVEGDMSVAIGLVKFLPALYQNVVRLLGLRIRLGDDIEHVGQDRFL